MHPAVRTHPPTGVLGSMVNPISSPVVITGNQLTTQQTSKVDADGRDVLCHEFLLAIPLDQARLARSRFSHADDLLSWGGKASKSRTLASSVHERLEQLLPPAPARAFGVATQHTCATAGTMMAPQVASSRGPLKRLHAPILHA